MNNPSHSAAVPRGGDRSGRPCRQRPRAGPAALPALAAVATVALLALVPQPTAAQGRDTPSLSFDLFGTVGGVYSTEDQADFVWNPFRPDGPGRSEDISPDVDSRVAGQVTASITPKLTAVVQGIAEQNEEDNYTPALEWAYVQYEITSGLTVRGGRTPIPAFLVSEFRKVSYANPWIRPPVEVYGLVPVFSLDGLDVRYRFDTGEWTSILHGTFGRADEELPSGGRVEAERVVHANYILRRGGLRARVGFARGELQLGAFDPLFDGFRQFGEVGEAVADRFDPDGTNYEFATLGVEYDPPGWFAMGEVAMIDFNSVLATSAAGYVSGGYRVGPVTPYVTYSREERVGETDLPGLPVAGLPPRLRGPAAGLNAALDGIRASSVVQQNVALGARWDVFTGVALKAQVDFIDMLDDSPGTFQNRLPGFERGGSAQLVSLATTFVF